MFKRVDKRRRKKEEEEKLGLYEEVKEILGIHDTDSEESDSDSDSDEGEEEEEEEGVADEEMNSGEEDEDNEEDEDEDNEDPSITVSQALKDPLYIVSVLPDIKACIVCPGKLLKSLRMVQLHRTSNACTLSLVYKTHFISSPFFLNIFLGIKFYRPIYVVLNDSTIALWMQNPTIMPGTF